MPTTYTLISSSTASGSASSLTFSSIPSTYTDLVVRISAREAGTAGGISFLTTFNGTSTAYSTTRLVGNGSAASSARTSSASSMLSVAFNNDGNSTANTFSSAELYIPNYTVSQNKAISGFGVNETNAVDVTMAAIAGLWQNTAAITSITFTTNTGSNIASGSSFYLYGIKNS